MAKTRAGIGPAICVAVAWLTVGCAGLSCVSLRMPLHRLSILPSRSPALHDILWLSNAGRVAPRRRRGSRLTSTSCSHLPDTAHRRRTGVLPATLSAARPEKSDWRTANDLEQILSHWRLPR